jgi:hypothetical protein
MTYTVRGPGSDLDNLLGTFTNKRKALAFAREQAQQIDNVVDVYPRGPILPAWVEGVTRRERIATFWPKESIG